MSDAKKIIDERLAKGEISSNEYDSLIKKMGLDNIPDLKKADHNINAEAKTSANQPEEMNMPPIIKKVVIFGGVYLAICLFSTIAIPKEDIYNSVLKGCGSQSTFCHCVAKAYSEQRTFLLAPFQSFGIFISKNAGAPCRGK